MYSKCVPKWLWCLHWEKVGHVNVQCNAALAVCPASKWLTLELGITHLCWATRSHPQHSSPYRSLSLSISFSPFSVDLQTGCVSRCVRQNQPTTICYQLCLEPLLTTAHGHSSCHSTVTEQLLVIRRHNRQTDVAGQGWIEEKEKQP